MGDQKCKYYIPIFGKQALPNCSLNYYLQEKAQILEDNNIDVNRKNDEWGKGSNGDVLSPVGSNSGQGNIKNNVLPVLVMIIGIQYAIKAD